MSALRAPAEERSLVEKLCTQHRLRRADVARIDIGGANGIGGVGAQALEGDSIHGDNGRILNR